MWYYWAIAIAVIVAIVAIVVYFATRQQPRAGAFDNLGGSGSGARAGAAASGIFGALGGLAEQIGIATDSGNPPMEGV